MAKSLSPGGIIYLKLANMLMNRYNRIFWSWTCISVIPICDIMGGFKWRNILKQWNLTNFHIYVICLSLNVYFHINWQSEDPMLSNNYRPVSLLCILPKVFEKIMYGRLLNFPERYILYDKQYGIRKKNILLTLL